MLVSWAKNSCRLAGIMSLLDVESKRSAMTADRFVSSIYTAFPPFDWWPPILHPRGVATLDIESRGAYAATQTRKLQRQRRIAPSKLLSALGSDVAGLCSRLQASRRLIAQVL